MGSAQDLRARLRGPVCSIPTAFTPAGELDEAAVRAVIDVAVGGGSQVVMLTWFDSLYPLLTDAEVYRLTEMVVSHVDRRAVVIAADRSWWTGEAAAYARQARSLGADLIMVKPPQLGHAVPDRLVEHFARVAEELPVMLVGHVPLQVLEQLAESVPGVVAFKDDVLGNYGFQVARRFRTHWPIITSGHLWEHAALWPYGATGWLSNFIVFAPQVDQQYWNAIQSGDLATARDVLLRYDEPWWDLAASFPGGADAMWHATLEVFGLGGRWRRAPFGAASDADLEQLRTFYRRLELLPTAS